ncbi:replication-associated recombination protein A [Pseudoflavonifractor phocaeensis]|uniref:replication-associated recombination protein A n=1 Tax=Pseudoflavonifractor phocaeensis TaxID=1870988 RepID=UPI001956D9E6|nr:replication-associated recombination protein A [Pseudoflavonifractor phocaeensis]MBM6884546.1 replication-associated recombination protein A [Pseudoflavonifractor phocaeensis]
MTYRPLADEIRPQTLDEVVGQQHILGENGLLRRIIQGGNIPNLVFYGPSGTGKTTVANLIAKRTHRPLHRLNATTASISDIKDIIGEIGTMLAPDGVLLYLDEIQYFNKKQQQSLLEFMENGKITLIASTTENPYFYVYNAVLSRSTVFEFKPLSAADVLPAIERGIRLMGERLEGEVVCEDGVQTHIAAACGGDVRKAMNAVELLLNSAKREQGKLLVTLADAQTVAQRSAMRYDREGDDHFDIASALMKSLRGSDPDAALHYLARLLEAGDLITAIRRLLCSASEDVGMAYPQAALIVKACVDNALQLGLPEARLPLAQAAVLLATAPKSNSVYRGIAAAQADVRAGKTGDYPRHLQNVHADSAGMEREQGYLYPHDFPNHWVKQKYLPDILAGTQYYIYGENKTEQAARRYWEEIKGRE